MSNTLWIVAAAMGVALIVGRAILSCLSTMLDEEIRARVDDLPAVIMELALRRMPKDMREHYRPDWEGNLLVAFNDANSRYPVTRMFKSIGFAASLFCAAGRVRKETRVVVKEAVEDASPQKQRSPQFRVVRTPRSARIKTAGTYSRPRRATMTLTDEPARDDNSLGSWIELRGDDRVIATRWIPASTKSKRTDP